MERDPSMLDLLKVVDPKMLKEPESETSALSLRGLAFTCVGSGFLWHSGRLLLRDFLFSTKWYRASKARAVVELNVLGFIHSALWVAFCAHKSLTSGMQNPQYVNRALSLSIGYYVHDLWALRSVFSVDPLMLFHQLCAFGGISSVLLSKGVSWMVPSLMTIQIPALVLGVLRLFSSLGLKGDFMYRSLRLIWFGSVVATKGVIVPTFVWKYMIKTQKQEFYQPSLKMGKISAIFYVLINQYWLFAAAKDLPSFMLKRGPVSQAMQRGQSGAIFLPMVLSGVASIVVSAFFGMFMVGPVGVPIMVLAARYGSRLTRRLAVLAAFLLALDRGAPLPDYGVKWFVGLMSLVFGTMKHYFPITVVEECDIRQDRNYMIGAFPHGFFPLGIAYYKTHLYRNKGIIPNTVAASVFKVLPVIGRFFSMVGITSATKSELHKCLKRKAPHNVTFILPGGIAEMFLIRPDIETVKCSSRKGFVEAALKAGVDLVPCYTLGTTALFEVSPPGSAMTVFFERVSRLFKMSILPFHGRWGTLIPYAHPLVVLVGKPIEIDSPVENPSPELIEEMHARFFREMRELFDRHKGKIPSWASKQLIFEGEGELPQLKPPVMTGYTDFPKLSKI